MTKGQKRDAPCGYKHILNFTDDVDEFSVSLNGLIKLDSLHVY